MTSRPAQFFGDISYSLYLWHWPVLVFGRFVTMGAPGPVGLTLCIVVSVVLATLSYRFIERPVLARHWRPRWALGSALAVVVMATLPSLTGVAQHGLPNRFAPPALDLLADKADFSPLRASCHADFARPATYADRCVLGAATLPDTLLWSDSIGVELAYALEPHFRRASRSVRQATASSCPPVLVGTGFGPACLSFNRDVLWSLAKDRAIQWVVLDAHYLGYRELGHTGTSGTEIADRLVETALHLDRIGKKVVILLPLPSYSIPVPDGLGVAAHLGLSLERQGQSRRAFERARSEVVQRLETASRRGNIRLVDPAGAFCNQSRCRASRRCLRRIARVGWSKAR